MALDVSDPQLVGVGTREVPVDEIERGRSSSGLAPPPAAREPLNPSPGHQHRDRVVADLDTAAQGELCMHPAAPIGARDAAWTSMI